MPGCSVDSRELHAGVAALMTPVRQVTAVMRFSGSPGRDDEAAEAWAFELTCYFLRGVSERPQVTYADGTGETILRKALVVP